MSKAIGEMVDNLVGGVHCRFVLGEETGLYNAAHRVIKMIANCGGC